MNRSPLNLENSRTQRVKRIETYGSPSESRELELELFPPIQRRTYKRSNPEDICVGRAATRQ